MRVIVTRPTNSSRLPGTASLAAFATVSGKLNSVAVCVLIVFVSPMLASAANRIQIKVDSSEADQALAIIAKHNAG